MEQAGAAVEMCWPWLERCARIHTTRKRTVACADFSLVLKVFFQPRNLFEMPIFERTVFCSLSNCERNLFADCCKMPRNWNPCASITTNWNHCRQTWTITSWKRCSSNTTFSSVCPKTCSPIQTSVFLLLLSHQKRNGTFSAFVFWYLCWLISVLVAFAFFQAARSELHEKQTDAVAAFEHKLRPEQGARAVLDWKSSGWCVNEHCLWIRQTQGATHCVQRDPWIARPVSTSSTATLIKSELPNFVKLLMKLLKTFCF